MLSTGMQISRPSTPSEMQDDKSLSNSMASNSLQAIIPPDFQQQTIPVDAIPLSQANMNSLITSQVPDVRAQEQFSLARSMSNPSQMQPNPFMFMQPQMQQMHGQRGSYGQSQSQFPGLQLHQGYQQIQSQQQISYPSHQRQIQHQHQHQQQPHHQGLQLYPVQPVQQQIQQSQVLKQKSPISSQQSQTSVHAPMEIKADVNNEVLEFSESQFIEKIRSCKYQYELPVRLEKMFGKPYTASSILYRVIINLDNHQKPSQAFKCYLEIEGLNDLRQPTGKKEGQSWIFDNEGQFDYFCPEFKSLRVPQNAPKFYECRMWQLDPSKKYKIEVQQNENEIVRCWFSSDQQIGKFHTLHKGEISTLPIPGSVAARASDHLFTLFGAKHIYFADASEKKDGIIMRLWDQIIKCSWYEGLTAFTESPTCPKKLGVAKHLKPYLLADGRELEQDPVVHAKALEKIRRYPLDRFYNIITKTQQKKLLSIYKTAFAISGKQENSSNSSRQKNGSSESKNPFENVSCTLQELVKQVDLISKQKKSKDDIAVALASIICDGIDLYIPNTYTKQAFTLGSPLTDFKSWVYTLIWGGYYREITPEFLSNSSSSQFMKM